MPATSFFGHLFSIMIYAGLAGLTWECAYVLLEARRWSTVANYVASSFFAVVPGGWFLLALFLLFMPGPVAPVAA